MENIAETPRTIFAKNKYSCAEERIAQLYLLFIGAISPHTNAAIMQLENNILYQQELYRFDLESVR